MRLVWYFDFVSPYSYLQFEAYPELMQTAELRPVLFAGLLNHWGWRAVNLTVLPFLALTLLMVLGLAILRSRSPQPDLVQ